MRKLLRASLLVTALLLVFGGSYLTAEAQVSPYATVTCQNMRDGSQVCRYGNGETATCTSGTDGAGGNIIECNNPDRSKTTCRREAVGNLDGRRQGSAGTRNVCTVVNADGTPGGSIDGTNSGGRTDTTTTAADGTVTEESKSNSADYSSCGPLDVGCWLLRLPGMLFTGIAFIFLLLSGMILGLAGTVFNWVVIRTVFQFGTYFGTNDGMLIAWGVMRDVANIGLLFGFIFMGVLLILNVDGGGHGGGGMSAKKAIPRLIIFAVLLNFSLFASQAVIDVANAFSSSFATLAGESCTGNTSTGNETADNASMDNEECSNVGISGQILKVAGLTSIWDSENRDVQKAMKNLVERPYSYAVSLIMLSIFVLITAMVLLAGSILLIIRVVILSLLMVTSPIGFAGMAIPKLQGIASMWWSKLMSQAFFAPVYLLLIFISIKLTEGLMEGEATLANALIANQGNSVAGNMQVVMVFMVVIGFMIGSLIMASKMGATGASFATSFAQRAVTYPFSVMGRGTIGAGSSKALGKYEASSGRARQRLKDIKNPIARFAATSALNVADDAAIGTLKGGKDMKFFGGRSFEEEEKHRKEQGNHNTHAADKAALRAELINAKDDEAAQAALQRIELGDIRELLEDSKVDLDTLARNLSPDMFSKLIDDKEVSSTKKHALDKGRYGSLGKIQELITDTTKTRDEKEANFKAAKDSIKEWSPEDIVQYAKSNPEGFKALAVLDNEAGESIFSDDQREVFEKTKSFTNATRKFVKDQGPVKRIDRYVAEGNLVKAKSLMGKVTKAKDRAKLDGKTLATREIVQTLSPSDLQEIAVENRLTTEEKDKILDVLTDPALSGDKGVKSLRDYLDNHRTNSMVRAYWEAT